MDDLVAELNNLRDRVSSGINDIEVLFSGTGINGIIKVEEHTYIEYKRYHKDFGIILTIDAVSRNWKECNVDEKLIIYKHLPVLVDHIKGELANKISEYKKVLR